MAIVRLQDGELVNIGNAIRGKLGVSTTYLPEEMAPAILTIPTTPPFEWGDETQAGAGTEQWWAGLKTWIQSASTDELASCLGKLKSVTLTTPVLGTTTHLVRCVGYNCDGEHTLTFQTMNCLATKVVFMTEAEYSACGNQAIWTDGTTDSTIRRMCKEYYNAFPGKASIAVVKKRYCATQDTNNYIHDIESTAQYDETVFVPSENEMGWTLESVTGSTTNGWGAGKNEFAVVNTTKQPYQYYSNDSRRIKYLGTDNNPEGQTSGGQGYWEKSRHRHSGQMGRLCRVYPDGKAYNQPYTTELGLAPAFAI